MILLVDFSVIYLDYIGIIILGILMILLVFLLVGLIDIFLRDFKDNMERIFWLLVIIFIVGFVIFFYVIKRKKLIK